MKTDLDFWEVPPQSFLTVLKLFTDTPFSREVYLLTVFPSFRSSSVYMFPYVTPLGHILRLRW